MLKPSLEKVFEFSRAQLVDREARQEEILANAFAVFENSVASKKRPADVSSSSENRPVRSRRLEDQARPVDERVIDNSRPADVASAVLTTGHWPGPPSC